MFKKDIAMFNFLNREEQDSSSFYPYIELEYEKDNLPGKCMKHTHEWLQRKGMQRY